MLLFSETDEDKYLHRLLVKFGIPCRDLDEFRLRVRDEIIPRWSRRVRRLIAELVGDSHEYTTNLTIISSSTEQALNIHSTDPLPPIFKSKTDFYESFKKAFSLSILKEIENIFGDEQPRNLVFQTDLGDLIDYSGNVNALFEYLKINEVELAFESVSLDDLFY